MLYVEENNTIKLTRGDTAYLEVPLVNDVTGEEFAMGPDDRLIFTVKDGVDTDVCCFQKTAVGTNCFKILPEDTAKCSFKRYKYDVQLELANGDVFTVIEPACFTVMPEVT